MMRIDQNYIDEEVVKPIMKHFADLENQITKVEKKINIAQISLNYLQKRIDENKKIIEKKK